MDLRGRASAVEPPQQAELVVVADERLRLRVVDLEAILDRLRLVVVTLDQPRAVDVADASFFGGSNSTW
jgi:hypothetical protein